MSRIRALGAAVEDYPRFLGSHVQKIQQRHSKVLLVCFNRDAQQMQEILSANIASQVLFVDATGRGVTSKNVVRVPSPGDVGRVLEAVLSVIHREKKLAVVLDSVNLVASKNLEPKFRTFMADFVFMLRGLGVDADFLILDDVWGDHVRNAVRELVDEEAPAIA